MVLLIIKIILSHKISKIIAIAIFSVLSFGNITNARASNSSSIISPAFTPSKPPVQIGFWVTISGYKTQPAPLYITEPGFPASIHTEVAKNPESIGGNHGAYYYWYQKMPGKNWEKITNKNKYVDPENSEINSNLNQPDYYFTSDTPGTYYFQAGAQVLPKGEFMHRFNPPLYSDLTSVVVAKPTKNLNITVDSNYLTNNRYFQIEKDSAHLQSDPVDANDIIDTVWSTNSNLISIDKESGEISVIANKNQSGTATIFATTTDVLNRKRTVQKDIQVGKMLTIDGTSDTFHVGDTPTLQIHGNYDKTTKITWYRQKGDSKPEKIPQTGSNYHFLQLNKLTKSDDDYEYYVEIHIPMGQNEYEYMKSNPIDLNVENDKKPKFEVKHTIKNLNDPTSTDQYEVANAKINDPIVHTVTMNRTNLDNSSIINGALVYPLSKSEKLESIKVNNIEVPQSNFVLDENHLLTIKRLPTNTNPFTISIQTRVTDLNENSFTYEPKFISTMKDNSTYKFGEIDSTSILFSEGSISLSAANIDFGKITILKYFSSLNERTRPNENIPIVEVKDNRRKKKGGYVNVEFFQDVY